MESLTHGPPLDRPRAAWWLPGPHLPTIYGKLLRRVQMPRTVREKVRTPDGDAISIERIRGDSNAPRVILFHGLEGGTHSTYARGLLEQARRRRWWADLVLWRTCDGTPVNATRRSYHSGASEDVELVVSHLLGLDPRPTLLHGVSLGGNVLLKWLGERGSQLPTLVRAAAAVSVPFDLAAASRRIDSGFSRVYSYFFRRSLVAKARAKLSVFPDALTESALRAVRTLWAFDDVVTAPLHGFADAADYYAQCSSLNYLGSIRCPTLLLNAQNDPFLPRSTLGAVREIAANNRYLSCEFPKGGGHVGFIAGTMPGSEDYWMERCTLDWLGCRAF